LIPSLLNEQAIAKEEAADKLLKASEKHRKDMSDRQAELRQALARAQGAEEAAVRAAQGVADQKVALREGERSLSQQVDPRNRICGMRGDVLVGRSPK
jgi:hypothetical protein